MMGSGTNVWPVRAPFIKHWRASEDDLDGFGHVNNVRYIDHALDVAWAHSEVLGFSLDTYKEIGIGCVVWRHEFDYVMPVLVNDDILIATWIAENDGRIRMVRKFEMRHEKTNKIVLRGMTRFVCIDMQTGKPARMPSSFVDAYKVAETS